MNAPVSKPTGVPVPVLDQPDLEQKGRAIISFDGVSKIFPPRKDSAEVKAVDDIDLVVPEGAIVGVIGKSGAGKSTLIRLINGLEQPTKGKVTVDGLDIGALDEKALRQARRSIGMIFQHFNLLSSRTAFDNIALPLEIAGTPRKDIPGIVTPLLDMVGLADKRDRYPAELSGGQKQRVGIARALATKPKVLLSDEATSALDPETTAQIIALLKQINAELNLTILFITHEMSVVKKLAQRVAVMEGGRIIEQGTTYEIFSQPQHATTKRFVGEVTGGNVPEWLQAKLLADYAPGRQAVIRIAFTGADADEPVLSRLTRAYGVDFNIMHGQIEYVADHPFGTLIASVAAEPELQAKLIADLTSTRNTVEHLGYVA